MNFICLAAVTFADRTVHELHVRKCGQFYEPLINFSQIAVRPF